MKTISIALGLGLALLIAPSLTILVVCGGIIGLTILVVCGRIIGWVVSLEEKR